MPITARCGFLQGCHGRHEQVFVRETRRDERVPDLVGVDGTMVAVLGVLDQFCLQEPVNNCGLIGVLAPTHHRVRKGWPI